MEVSLRGIVSGYDASIFSLAAFAQPLPHPQYIIAPSIDPLSEKNIELEAEEVRQSPRGSASTPPARWCSRSPASTGSRTRSGWSARAGSCGRTPIQLVLAGSTATDDPEGAGILDEVRREAGGDPDIHILLLPADSHRTVNALQRRAEIVLQKSIREGFGLTVTEALWKRKPVIGGRAGGITLQVIDYHTGFLVATPEGAAFRMRYLLGRPETIALMGEKGRRFVAENFLLTRNLREHLTLMVGLLHGAAGPDRDRLGRRHERHDTR